MVPLPHAYGYSTGHGISAESSIMYRQLEGKIHNLVTLRFPDGGRQNPGATVVPLTWTWWSITALADPKRMVIARVSNIMLREDTGESTRRLGSGVGPVMETCAINF